MTKSFLVWLRRVTFSTVLAVKSEHISTGDSLCIILYISFNVWCSLQTASESWFSSVLIKLTGVNVLNPRFLCVWKTELHTITSCTYHDLRILMIPPLSQEVQVHPTSPSGPTDWQEYFCLRPDSLVKHTLWLLPATVIASYLYVSSSHIRTCPHCRIVGQLKCRGL